MSTRLRIDCYLGNKVLRLSPRRKDYLRLMMLITMVLIKVPLSGFMVISGDQSVLYLSEYLHFSNYFKTFRR